MKTTRFGVLKISEEEWIRFPMGLYGFKENRSFVLLDTGLANPLFSWLQATDDPDLAFVVLDPFTLCSDYFVRLTQEQRELLQCTGQSELSMRVIVGMPGDPEEMTVNMKGPIVNNSERGIAIQTIVPGDTYSTRLRVLDAARSMRPPDAGQEMDRPC